MMCAKWWVSLCLSAAFSGVSSAAMIGALAPYSTDEEGWVGSTTSTTQIWLANGGNPAGHLELRKDLTPPVFDIGSRNSTDPDFLGNYAASGITGAGFDLNVYNTTIAHAYLRFRRNVNENGWRYDFGAVLPNSNQWEEFDVSFNPAWDDLTARANGWLTDDDVDAGADPSPAFAAVMADVGWIEVRLASEGSTIVGIDNVRLVPEPGSIALLAWPALLLARRPQR